MKSGCCTSGLINIKFTCRASPLGRFCYIYIVIGGEMQKQIITFEIFTYL